MKLFSFRSLSFSLGILATLFLLAVSAQAGQGPLRWYVCGRQARECQELRSSGVVGNIHDIQWSASGDLLAYGERANSDVTARNSERHDWWLLADDGSPTTQ